MSTVTIAGILAVALICGSCCQRSVGEQERSPTGEWVALVTVTDCGAFSDYATAVTLRRTRGWLARDKLVVGLIAAIPSASRGETLALSTYIFRVQRHSATSSIRRSSTGMKKQMGFTSNIPSYDPEVAGNQCGRPTMENQYLRVGISR